MVVDPALSDLDRQIAANLTDRIIPLYNANSVERDFTENERKKRNSRKSIVVYEIQLG
jgi:hypothetical protein